MAQLFVEPGKVVRENGNVDEAFAKGGKIVEAEYYAPLLAHASMEPPAALAVYRDGKAEVWAPTQGPQGARDAIAQALGLKKEDVTVHVTLLGGGFGREQVGERYEAERLLLLPQTLVRVNLDSGRMVDRNQPCAVERRQLAHLLAHA